MTILKRGKKAVALNMLNLQQKLLASRRIRWVRLTDWSASEFLPVRSGRQTIGWKCLTVTDTCLRPWHSRWIETARRFRREDRRSSPGLCYREQPRAKRAAVQKLEKGQASVMGPSSFSSHRGAAFLLLVRTDSVLQWSACDERRIWPRANVYGHTTVKKPVLVRPPKSSTASGGDPRVGMHSLDMGDRVGFPRDPCCKYVCLLKVGI